MIFQVETERLYLCEWTGDEADEFLPIAQDPRVMRYITWWRSFTSSSGTRVHRSAIGASRGPRLLPLEVDRETGHARDGRLIGFCGLQPLAGTDEVEVGYWLAFDCWGKGLATEAATRALEFAFNERQMERVVAVAMPENAASLKVMEHLGMRYVGDSEHKGTTL